MMSGLAKETLPPKKRKVNRLTEEDPDPNINFSALSITKTTKERMQEEEEEMRDSQVRGVTDYCLWSLSFRICPPWLARRRRRFTDLHSGQDLSLTYSTLSTSITILNSCIIRPPRYQSSYLRPRQRPRLSV